MSEKEPLMSRKNRPADSLPADANRQPLFPVKKIFTPKNITVLAMLLAIRAILNLPFLTIYITPQFKLLTFSYVTDAIAAMLFGPFAALAFGFLGDLLGYFAEGGGGGAYFPGFALSEMLTCLIFAIFFYGRQIKLLRTIICWLIDLAVVVLGLNSLWLIVIYGQPAGMIFNGARIVNALIQAPVHIAILFFLLPQVRKLHRRIS